MEKGSDSDGSDTLILSNALLEVIKRLGDAEDSDAEKPTTPGKANATVTDQTELIYLLKESQPQSTDASNPNRVLIQM